MHIHRLELRVDVLEAIRRELCGAETLDDIVMDLAHQESSARKRHETPRIDCMMTSPVETVLVNVPGALGQLREFMRPGENLSGLVTALLIAEVRHRRTGLHWPVCSADELVMTDDADTIHTLMQGHNATTRAISGGHLMHTITTDVRADVLDAFDATLDDWETRSEEIAALIHLEDEVRDEGAHLVSGHASPMRGATTSVDLDLDPHDHAALKRLLRDGGEVGPLLTALMLRSLTGVHRGVTRADGPLLIPA